MNKKLTKLLSVFVIAGAIGTGVAGITACSPKQPETPEHTHTAATEWQSDANGHWHNCTANDGAKLNEGTHADPNSDGKCDVCDYQMTTPAEATITGVEASASKTEATVGEEIALTATVSGTGNYDKTVTWAITEGSDKATLAGATLTVTAEGTVKVQATANGDNTKKSAEIAITVTAAQAEMIDVTYELKVDEKLETGKTAEERRTSIFTLGANTEVRGRTKANVYENAEGGALVSNASYTKSIKLGGSTDAFIINAPEAGTLTIHVQNGSSGTKDWQKLILTKPDGSTEEIKYAAYDGSPLREVVIQFAEKGIYKLTRTSGTSDIFYAKFVAKVRNTPLESIEVVSSGVAEYFVGQDYSTRGIELNKVFAETQRTEPLDVTDPAVSIDYSAVDKTQSGVYNVVVKYTENGKHYTQNIQVTYYAVESLVLGRNKIVTGSNSYNGIYVNQHLRELYISGEQFSTAGLTVHVNGSLGSGESAVAKDFIISNGYTISGNDETTLSTAGKHTITVSLDGTNVTATFDVFVVSGIADLSTATTLDVSVDGTLADANVGVIGSNGYQFQTIQQAIEFIENCGISDSAIKTINLAAGTYNEKIEINVPNVSIVGAGTGETGYSLIEWDALYGIEDESGFVHTTDSTATLNVREKATGFSIKNVIISNYYNSLARFDEALGVGYSEHRALAMLVQADKVVIDSCSLLGYQDTVEFFTGRQLVKNSYICGYTDFIFGTNNTTYFNGCTIESIAGKDAATHGGYITAFKGVNKSGTKVTYGAIFDDCDFIAETGSAEGMTAIGRPWGADAAVMVMNSRLGAHISTVAYNGESRDVRYVAMTNEPQNAQFTEYNNTGAGAITESQTITKGGVTKNIVTVLDATTAANYNNLEVIFGTTNGEVTYPDVWNGNAGAKITSESYNFAEIAKGETRTFNEVYAGKLELQEGGKARWNGNSIQTSKGTVIKVLSKGEITVDWFGSGYGAPEDGLITYTDGYATLTLVNDGKYITKITVNFEVVPEDTVLYDVTFDLGYEGATAEVVKVIKEQTVVKPADPIRDGYTFAGWYNGDTEYDFTAVVTGALTITAHWTSGVEEVIFDTDTVINLVECETTFEGTKGVFNGVEIDATNGKFAPNGDWRLFNAGTILKFKVAEGAVVTYVEYQDAGKISLSTRDADGYISLTATANTYIKTISISYAVDFTKNATLNLAECTVNYEGSTGYYKGVEIDATSGKFANNNGGWIQFNEGATLTFTVAAGAQVTITEYGDKGACEITIDGTQATISVKAGLGSTYISVLSVSYDSVA